MSFASLFWAIAALMQSCMLSKFGQKHLQLAWWDSQQIKQIMVISCFVFLAISMWMNYRFEGLSVGLLTWLFVIVPTAFFIQILLFYRLKKKFLLLWKLSLLAAVIFSIFELISKSN